MPAVGPQHLLEEDVEVPWRRHSGKPSAIPGFVARLVGHPAWWCSTRSCVIIPRALLRRMFCTQHHDDPDFEVPPNRRFLDVGLTVQLDGPPDEQHETPRGRRDLGLLARLTNHPFG